MKTLVLIIFLCISVFFLTTRKPEPSIIEIKNAPATQNCLSPNNIDQHKGHSNIKGRAYYIIELAKEVN